jgi:hypothetical protein
MDKLLGVVVYEELLPAVAKRLSEGPESLATESGFRMIISWTRALGPVPIRTQKVK